MKILIMLSATTSSSLSHRGLSFATELQALGNEVTIMAPRRDKYSNNADDMPTSTQGVTILYPAMGKGSATLGALLRYALSATGLVFRQRADVVIIMKPTPITIIGLLSKLRFKATVIADVDDLGSEVMATEGQSPFRIKLVALSESLAKYFADGIVVASRLLETEVRHSYPKKNIVRLSNGVDASLFRANSATRQTQIIFFGALNREGILSGVLDSMPAVIKAFPDITLQILGGGSSLKALQVRANGLGIASNVAFNGWTKLADFNSYTQLGDIGLCIMPDERTTAACSNQKVFQYMASGLCTVASSVGDLPLYLENPKAGVLVASGDQNELSNSLIELINNPATRVAMARQGLNLAQSRFSWQHLSQELMIFLVQVKES